MSKKRPEHVRCEMCAFYCQTQALDDMKGQPSRGECRRRSARGQYQGGLQLDGNAPLTFYASAWFPVDPLDWCGEWSDTWPGGDSHE